MAKKWRIVKLFISSTFLDMQGERDYLVRFVFPKLREKLLLYRIHLVDVDLRWGITSEQDTLKMCREIIDECRPYFMCILGGRYGWIPPGAEISITAQEIHYAIYNRPHEKDFRFFYFRTPNITESINECKPGIYKELPGSPEEEKLNALKQQIIAAGHDPRIYACRWDTNEGRIVGLEGFGNRVYTDLLGIIEAEIAGTPSATVNEFEEENAAIESFIERRILYYVVGSRKQIFKQLHGHTTSKDGNNILCVTGEPGSGKSALLGQFYRDYIQKIKKQPDADKQIVIPHFIGASASSTSVRQMLRRLCHELILSADLNDDIPERYEELRDFFSSLLKKVADNKHFVILIDAVNQLDPADNAEKMQWLPKSLPENVRIILTTLPGPALEALRALEQPLKELALNPLNKTDLGKVIDEFSFRYKKTLDFSQRDALLKKKEAGIPLYLLTALEELRTLGEYEKINEYIKSLPEKTKSLFIWILRRLENGTEFRDTQGHLEGRTLVRHYFMYLATSRFGMEQKELTDLVQPGDPLGNLAALQRLVRPFIMMRGPLINFFHNQLKYAVEDLYLRQEKEYLSVHHCLAEYFRQYADPLNNGKWDNGSSRGLSEMAYHLLKGRDIKSLTALYNDPLFLQTMIKTVNIKTLKDDKKSYMGIFELLANVKETILLLKTSNKTEYSQLEWQFNTLFDLLAERSDLFRRFPYTIIQEINNYIDLFSDAAFPELLLQRAHKHISSGIVIKNKQKIHRILGHTAAITTLSVAASGDYFLSGGADGSVGYWHKDVKDHPLWLVNAHKSWVTCADLSPDGRKALSTGDDGSIFLWDVELGTRRSLPPFDHKIFITPWPQAPFCAFLDDEIIMVHRFGDCLKINLRTEFTIWRSTKRMFNGLRNYNEGVLFDFSGISKRLAVFNPLQIEPNSNNFIDLWDCEKGEISMTLKRPGFADQLAISSDAYRMLLADPQGHLTAYDMTTGRKFKCITTSGFLFVLCRSFKGHLFFGCDNSGNLYKIWLEDKIKIKLSGILDEMLYYSLNIIRCMPDNKTLIIGTNSGAILVADTDSGSITHEWKVGSLFAKGTIFPGGHKAMVIKGPRVLSKPHIGNELMLIHASGKKELLKVVPHQHSISDVAAIGPRHALSVDRGGSAVIWKKNKSKRIYKFSDTDFISCTRWSNKVLGIAGTRNEEVIILNKKKDRIPMSSTPFEFKAGIVALAAAGSPIGILSNYANGLVCFYREKKFWCRDPEQMRHSLSGTAAALDPGCIFGASGNMNGEIQIWGCNAGKIEAELSLHHGEVISLAFNSNGSVLYTAGSDRYIYGIDIKTKDIIKSTILPLVPIALHVEHNKLFVLDSSGNIYSFLVERETKKRFKRFSHFSMNLLHICKDLLTDFLKGARLCSGIRK